MVFLCGPRQGGKTWLAKKISEQFSKTLYLNYDRLEDREIIKREGWRSDTELTVFDEIHKMPDWKNYVKGVFDTRNPGLRILVTGSSRLDVFHQAGDSLAGRYFRHRLLPFSPAELKKNNDLTAQAFEKLILQGGFPEPFLAEDTVDSDRWRMQYVDGLIRTDVLDFERIHDFRAIALVFELLRRRVGSPVSYSSIAEDAQVSPNTVKKYIDIFEALYIVFKVTPFSKNIARSLLKEPKIYFYDTGLIIGDEGARFENFVALNLLKHVCGLVDYKGESWALHYLRTKDGDEVDFCLCQNEDTRLMIETKIQYREIPSSLLRFHNTFGIPAVLAINDLKKAYVKDGISIEHASTFLSDLFL